MRGVYAVGLQVRCRLIVVTLLLAVVRVHSNTNDVNFRLLRQTPSALISTRTSDIWQKVTEQLRFGWPRHVLADDGLLWQRSMRRRHSYDDVINGEVQIEVDDALVNSGVDGEEQSEDRVIFRENDIHRKQIRTDRVDVDDDVNIVNKRTGNSVLCNSAVITQIT